jgi:hypothetical protein
VQYNEALDEARAEVAAEGEEFDGAALEVAEEDEEGAEEEYEEGELEYEDDDDEDVGVTEYVADFADGDEVQTHTFEP